MATTMHAPTQNAASSGNISAPHILTTLAAHYDTSTAAARVVEHLIHLEQDKAFKEAQRARAEMEDATSLMRAFLRCIHAIGPDPRAMQLLARDAAELVARVEARQ